MDGYWNLKKDLGNDLSLEGDRVMNEASSPLSRQGSIYPWRVNQFQNILGKDCWSMNIDELITNINSAENTQGEWLQRQDSMNLPPTLNQKTVDEVWKYITEEEEHTHTVGDGGGTNIPHIQRQQTLGDITLEEFLIHANNNNGSYFCDPISANPNTSLGVGFQQKPLQQFQGFNLHRNVNESMSTYQPQQQQQNQLQPQQTVMSKPHGYGYGYGYGTQIGFPSVEVNTGGPMRIGTFSPVTPLPLLDEIRKFRGDSSLLSQSPYIFSGSNNVRSRKRNNRIAIAMEKKVDDKTQRRKIKNRESAARSLARKQAYIMELEYEVEKLKKENQELLRKQAEMSKIQTKPGMINLQGRPERQLRRTKSDIN